MAAFPTLSLPQPASSASSAAVLSSKAMKLAPFVLLLALSASSQPVPTWFPGEISLPPRYTIVRTGTIDSDRGEITAPDGFKIGFDIGYMAGAHMHERRKSECEWLFEHTIAKQKAWTGVRRVQGKRVVTTTIYSHLHIHGALNPANFWATLRNEKDLAVFLAIVSTYNPPKPPARQRKP